MKREQVNAFHRTLPTPLLVPPRRARPLAGHADAEARRSVLTALLCATLVTVLHHPILPSEKETRYRGTSPIRKTRPTRTPPRILGIGLR